MQLQELVGERVMLGTLSRVQAPMLGCVGQHQIFDAVVVPDFVDVMDDFVGSQKPAKVLLHHQAMLRSVAAANPNPDIATRTQYASANPPGVLVRPFGVRSGAFRHQSGPSRPLAFERTKARRLLRRAPVLHKGPTALLAGPCRHGDGPDRTSRLPDTRGAVAGRRTETGRLVVAADFPSKSGATMSALIGNRHDRNLHRTTPEHNEAKLCH